MVHNQSLSLDLLNLPNNPTARKFLELIGHYQVRSTVHNDGPRFTAPDLSEAKGNQKWDFTIHFLSNLTSNKNGDSKCDSSNPNDVWVLEGDSLKEFKVIYENQLGISLGRINKLTVVGWNTAYHYLVQGHSDTAKDFSKLGADSVAESFKEETQDQYKLPQNYIEALEALVASEKQKKLAEEEKQLAEEKLGEAEAEDTLYTYRVIVSPESCLDEAEDTLDAYRAILSPEACLDFKQVADGLQIPGLGRTNLFKYLRQKNFIVQNGRVPLHRRIEEKLAVVETTSISIKTKFTFKGLEWLIKKLIEDGYQVHQTAREIWDKYH
jgi:hypothetical protein